MEWVRDVLHYITVLLIMDWIDIAKPWHVALDARGLAGEKVVGDWGVKGVKGEG